MSEYRHMVRLTSHSKHISLQVISKTVTLATDYHVDACKPKCSSILIIFNPIQAFAVLLSSIGVPDRGQGGQSPPLDLGN